MSGICGIYGVEDKTLIEQMLSALRHRGPDGGNILIESNISLGYAGLNVTGQCDQGLLTGNEDGNIWVCNDGEIYNSEILRAQLQKRGHRFNSDADSEVIIHCYEEYGLEFASKLRGDFALSLWNSANRKLILARDPLGVKPLYYSFTEGVFIFASEIKAILEAGIEKAIDDEGLRSYLAYHYVLGSKTMFKNINKVLPGNILILESGNISTLRYWDIYEGKTTGDENYAVGEFRRILEESIKIRTATDLPMGAFLSGGIDSSAIVALAKTHTKNQFHTFSAGFETFSELKYADAVSKHVGTIHHEIIITPEMIMQDLPRIAWYFDEPLGDAATINIYYLSREASKYTKVVLMGEGGDEVLGGYSEYTYGLKYFSLFNKLPQFARSTARLMIDQIPQKGNICASSNRIHHLSNFFFQTSLERALLYTRRGLNDAEINYLTGLDSENINDMTVVASQMRDPLNKMQAIDCKNLLPEKYLMKVDKGVMANSVEARFPFMDKELVNFAFSLPPNLKINNGQGKYILRKAVEDILPGEIVHRKKHGFGTPVGAWMSGRMANMVCQKLQEGDLIKQILKPDKVQAILRDIERGSVRCPQAVWGLFALELWHEIYFQDDVIGRQ